jgi:hypothetical protein
MNLKEMDAEMLRCLLWLLLRRNGGQATFDRNDLPPEKIKAELLLVDGANEMTLKIVPAGTAETVERH